MVFFDGKRVTAQADQSFDIERVLLVKWKVRDSVRVKNNDFSTLRRSEFERNSIDEKVFSGYDTKLHYVVSAMINCPTHEARTRGRFKRHCSIVWRKPNGMLLAADNQSLPDAEDQYFERLADGFKFAIVFRDHVNIGNTFKPLAAPFPAGWY